MLTRYALPLLVVALSSSAAAQNYCAPTFQNGCFSWHSQSILLANMEWYFDGDCSVTDHTDMSATVEPGVPATMSVTSGNWTGCAVWADLNNDFDFSDDENLFYSYVGGDPGFEYLFDITVPANTPNGTYLLRVVSPWGSDGFQSTNENGFGACGDYQYGGFDDFLLNVINTSSVAENTELPVTVGPNPTEGPLMVSALAGTAMQRIAVWSADGRLVHEYTPTTSETTLQLDLSGLQAGMYRVQCLGQHAMRTFSIVKQ